MHSLCVGPECNLDDLVRDAAARTRPGDPVVVILPSPPLSINVIPSVGARAHAQLLAAGASLDPTNETLVLPMRINPRGKSYAPASSWAARRRGWATGGRRAAPSAGTRAHRHRTRRCSSSPPAERAVLPLKVSNIERPAPPTSSPMRR